MNVTIAHGSARVSIRCEEYFRQAAVDNSFVRLKAELTATIELVFVIAAEITILVKSLPLPILVMLPVENI
jgi:hypothetical protein